MNRKSSVLRPTCTHRRALGRSAQVGCKLSHEQNCLMRTKERPAPGKTTLFSGCFAPKKLSAETPQIRWSCGSRQLAVAGRSLDIVEPNPIHGRLLVLV